MQQIVNQIYWPSAGATYMYGTNLKTATNLSTLFSNNLLAVGAVIANWNSVGNYQASKLVPQLPILKIGHQYRINVHATSIPDQTFIVRLVFRDLQGNELKRIDFRSRQRIFVVPEATCSYSISLINAGCRQIHFDRIDLCPSDISTAANQDVWLHSPLNQELDQPLTLLLINDGRTSRSTLDYLTKYTGQLRIQPISMAWQFRGQALKVLKPWLVRQSVTSLRIISTAPTTDRLALQLQREYPQAELLLTDQAKIETKCKYSTFNYLQPAMWLKETSLGPDWLTIFNKVNQLWGSLSSDVRSD